MTDTVIDNYEKRKVMYDGDNREYLRGKVGTVVNVVRNVGGITLGVEYPDGSIEYGASWAWHMLPEDNEINAVIKPVMKTFDMDQLFTDASGGKLEVAENEIKRLEARIAELKKFVEVYKSL